MKSLPSDYYERVYAGVLGKIIGVYLGRPFEQWSHHRIEEELGEVDYYVHDRLGVPLIVTDDDISGTFAFLRALEESGADPDLTPARIGRGWLNAIIEGESILWWGGLGCSTEHTAFLRLKAGIEAPASGSIALNGKIVAEQIGAQIFIDGWAMVCPGDPERAAELARRAAVVSHDGEAVYGAQVIAAMEALAFVETDLDVLTDTALGLIPSGSVIHRSVQEIREWCARDGDWRRTLGRIHGKYGYDQFGGGCHIVPNHALIHLALQYGNGDFQRSQMIVNTAGYDTDCNAGNLGCLLGIRNGLKGLDTGPGWRDPVADRLFLATSDGGGVITDAVQVADRVARLGYSLAGVRWTAPKDGTRFHFTPDGSVQGFVADEDPESAGVLTLGHGRTKAGQGCLELRFEALAAPRIGRARVATFIPPESLKMSGYRLEASPVLYPGQTVTAVVEAPAGNTGSVEVALYRMEYEEDASLKRWVGEPVSLDPGARRELRWTLEPGILRPVAFVGVQVGSTETVSGCVRIDRMGWEGEPAFRLPERLAPGSMVSRAFVHDMDQFFNWNRFWMISNGGRRVASIGTRDWRDIRVSAVLSAQLAEGTGVAVRYQGLRRYYAMMLEAPDRLAILKVDHEVERLAEVKWAWELGISYRLELAVIGNRLVGSVDGSPRIEATDRDDTFKSGGAALLVDSGAVVVGAFEVAPAD